MLTLWHRTTRLMQGGGADVGVWSDTCSGRCVQVPARWSSTEEANALEAKRKARETIEHPKEHVSLRERGGRARCRRAEHARGVDSYDKRPSWGTVRAHAHFEPGHATRLIGSCVPLFRHGVLHEGDWDLFSDENAAQVRTLGAPQRLRRRGLSRARPIDSHAGGQQGRLSSMVQVPSRERRIEVTEAQFHPRRSDCLQALA